MRVNLRNRGMTRGGRGGEASDAQLVERGG